MMTDPWLSSRRLAVGEVGLIREPRKLELLVVAAVSRTEELLAVVPISDAVGDASEWDMAFPRELLGYAAIAEAWNHGWILPEQAFTTIAAVPASLMDGLRRLVKAAATSGKPPADLEVGPPILSAEDPRLLFQEEESERASRFWEPALVLAGAATLGELVRHRREELRLAETDLEAEIGQPGWASGLERDALDVRHVLPPVALAALFRRLEIGASRRLRRIARTTLEAQTPSFARHGGSGDDPGIEGYLDEFLSELSDDA